MRTEPSFSAKSEGLEPEASFASQEELNLPDEPSPTLDTADEPQHLVDYRRRYGLSMDPFADDQHFPLYTGGQRRQILDQLLHVCQFSHNLLVVLGGYSVGKTRMAQALIDSLDDADDICFIEGQVTSSFDSLMESVLAQFELPDMETFHEFVRKQSDADGLAVLIIDNAHHLTDDVLLQLIDLIRPGQETRVHLVFFAESHLLPRLQGLDVEEVALSDFQLIKFSLAETVDYLNFRMEMADYLGPELFTEANVETWWRQSRGQLLELHQYAQDKLLTSASASSAAPSSREVAYVKKGLPVPHIVGAAALGAMLIMGLVYLGGGSSDKEPAALTTIPIPKIVEQPVASAQSASEPSAVNAATEVAVAAGPSEQPVASPAPEQSVKTSPVASVAASSTAAAQSVAPETQVIKQTVIPLVKANGVAQGVSSAKASSLAAVKEPAKVEAVKKPEVQPEKIAAKKVESSVAPSEKTKIAAESGGYSEQEKTLLSWGESEFTLQLVGLSTEKAVRDFIAQQPNRKDLLLFKSLRQGKDWFVVVTGRYSSSAKARQAVSLLPEAQRKATPWPRDLKTIQREIMQR